MQITTSKVTGTPDSENWTQVHEFIPQEENKISNRGRLVAIISTSNSEEGVDVVVAGREILARLHEEYYGDLSDSPFIALKEAVQNVGREFESELKNLEISAAAIIADNIFLAALGGQAFIFRNGMFVEILGRIGGGASASGKIKSSDIFVLSTSKFTDLFTKNSLSRFLSEKNFQRSIESITSLAHSYKGSGSIGATFIKIRGVETAEAAGGEGNYIERKKFEFENFPRNMINSAKRFNLKENLLKKNLYVHKSEPSVETVTRKKATFSAGIVLLILLMVSIGFGIKQKKEVDIRKSYEARLLQAKHDYDEALNLVSLSPERARELFANSRTAAVQLSDEGVEDEELAALLELIKKNKGEVLGEYTSNVDLFVDLSLLSEGFSSAKLTESGGMIYILDSENSRVASASIATKKAEIVAGPGQVSDSLDIASYSDRVFLLKDDGIYELTEGKNKVIDKNWEGEVMLKAYAGNLYVLEKYGTVARFAGGEAGIGDRKDWVASGIESDFTDAIDWSIDGSVWILTENGRVEKYTLGNLQRFTLRGVAPELVKPTSIFTNDKLEYIYILEPESSRIVVITKEGDFKAQYLSDDISRAIDFAVSETEKKAILLAENNLLSFPLDHF